MTDKLYRCHQCLDDEAGWIELACPQDDCGRRADHAAHTFTVKCPHWLRQHAEAIQENARKALADGKRPSQIASDLQDLNAGTYRWRAARTRIHRPTSREDAA